MRFVAVEGQLRRGNGRGGRGAWLCLDGTLDCFDAARGRWARVLRGPVTAESVAALRGELAGDDRNRSGSGGGAEA